MNYPPTRTDGTADELHGVRVPDPYRWLEALDSPETRAWIEAQNQVTFDYLGDAAGRESLRERITELWNYERFGVPRMRGGRYFFTRNDGLQNQAVLYRLDGLDGEPEVLLDPNPLSDDGTVAMVNFVPSRDGKLVAYGLAGSGSDWNEWKVRNVETGEDMSDHLQWVKWSAAEWLPDGSGFYYSRYDAPEGEALKEANYNHKLYFHRIGTAQDDDQLIYERPDQKEWGFYGQVTEDGELLVISVWMGTHRENGLFYKVLREPATEVVELLCEFDAKYQLIGNDGPLLYVMTDADAPKMRVIGIDLRHPERDQWREIVPEAEDALETVRLVGDRLVAIYLKDAHSHVRMFDLVGRPILDVELPGLGTVFGFFGHRGDREDFYLFTSYTTPGEIYRIDIETGKSEAFRRPELRFDPDMYETRQVFFASKDGTRIPMFLTHRKGFRPDGDTPTFLTGYGGFNIPLTPAFSVANLVWMEMGGLFAQPNLRGGGEYGKAWHEAGMKLVKQNVFDDFIAAAEWLVAEGYTRSERLAIGGGSNGGLLVGACMTQRPELFGAVIPAVGVLDMLRFHKWTIGWAWVSDYGSPDDPDEFRALLDYSPYHNLDEGTAYPATLVVTGDHDDRVFPAHSFKFAARLQACQAGGAPTLIRVETKAGHGLGKPTSKLIEELVDKWSFLVKALGIEP